MWLKRAVEGIRRHETNLPRPDEERRAEDYPAPYPSGWYKLADADELRPGDTRYLEVLGERLVLFRDEQGRPHVLDAHCPHQGANLAGGKVRGQCIECPFHAWRFDGDGQVREIPYAARVSPSLRTRSWPVIEHAGMWLMYFQPGRGPRDHALQPAHELADIDGLDRMRFMGRRDAGEVRMHLIEFAENSVDFAHFSVVHGQMLVPWTNFRVPFVDIEHVAKWERDPVRPHMAYFHDHATLLFRGQRRPSTATRATITFHGPGGLVDFRFHLRDLGDIVMFQTHTPIAPLRQRVSFRWYADPKIPRPLVSYVVGSWVTQWRADIGIWENKVYKKRPMLVAEDGPVHEMRRWFSAFYPDTTPGTSSRSLDLNG